jgi:hypothetical protein
VFHHAQLAFGDEAFVSLTYKPCGIVHDLDAAEHIIA